MTNKLQCWRAHPHLKHEWYVEDFDVDGQTFACKGIETKVHKYTPDAGWCATCGPDVPTGQQTTPVSIIHQTEWKHVCIHCGVDMFSREDEFDYKTNWYPSDRCLKGPLGMGVLPASHEPTLIPVLPKPSSDWLKNTMEWVIKKRKEAVQPNQASTVTHQVPNPYRPKNRG